MPSEFCVKSNDLFTLLPSSSVKILSIVAFSKATNHEKRPTPFPPMAALYVESDSKKDLKLLTSKPIPLSDTVIL